MNTHIAEALTRHFERHRIIFWYDSKQELRADFESLDLPGITRLELRNNEYGIKYRVLRTEPDQKFLLYHDGPPPSDLDNWLLDVQLAHYEFRTDKVGTWLSELSLGLEFAEMIEAHAPFFQSTKRLDALKGVLKADDSSNMIQLKMLAVCVGSEPRVDAILESLLQELAEKREDKIGLIQRCALDGLLWQQMDRHYSYRSNEPGIRDFVIALFKSCYAMGVEQEASLSADALVFLKRWKDSRQFEAGFEMLSSECSEVLGIEQLIHDMDFRTLIELDYFRLIDQKIISDLVREVTAGTASPSDVSLWIRQRRQSHWYGAFRHLYEALEHASSMIRQMDGLTVAMDNLADGVRQYCKGWFSIDHLYRKFTYHVRISGHASLMSPLIDRIENLYTNAYLLKLGDQFQQHVEQAEVWEAEPVRRQDEFFTAHVRPFINKGTKVCVIISDAMRYEVGEELLRLIRQEDRYQAEIEPMLAMLPSYTQLGMAALLPGSRLEIADREDATVLVDGQSSQGKENRIKILQSSAGERATACKADELLAMKGDDCRALIRDHDLIYIYHNRIDATGDKRETEEQVFEAVDKTLEELVRLIKKLSGANASNILLTADHGFIYQNRAIDESDFSGAEASGEVILYRNRRFVLGKGLEKAAGLHTFMPDRLGLAGSVEVHIPTSINRLRRQGSGSRFVHGGATLQEVVIPLLKINKRRQSDVSLVEVEILRGANSVITSGQVAIPFYQASPITDKVQPRTLVAGIYSESGTLISDKHELTFDMSAENPREREYPVRFVLTRQADEVNGQDVLLRLQEKVAGTSHYREYKSLRLTVRRSFTSEFDF